MFNIKYLKIGLILLPLVFAIILFLLPDKGIRTDENIPQDIVEYAEEIYGDIADTYIVKSRGVSIAVKWADPANAPPGDPDLDVYLIMADPYAEDKNNNEQTQGSIIVRNNNGASVNVTDVSATFDFDYVEATVCTGELDGSYTAEVSCMPETPTSFGAGVMQWSGDSWSIAAYGQRAFVYTHDATTEASADDTMTVAVTSSANDPGDEVVTLFSDQKCGVPRHTWSFDNSTWYQAYPQDGTAAYFSPDGYTNQHFYYSVELCTTQENVTYDDVTLEFPDSWNVDSCTGATGAVRTSTCTTSGNTVTLDGAQSQKACPDGWRWDIQVDLPVGGGFGLASISSWGTSLSPACVGWIDNTPVVEFPIYIGAPNVVQKHYRWRDDDGGE